MFSSKKRSRNPNPQQNDEKWGSPSRGVGARLPLPERLASGRHLHVQEGEAVEQEVVAEVLRNSARLCATFQTRVVLVSRVLGIVAVEMALSYSATPPAPAPAMLLQAQRPQRTERRAKAPTPARPCAQEEDSVGVEGHTKISRSGFSTCASIVGTSITLLRASISSPVRRGRAGAGGGAQLIRPRGGLGATLWAREG